MVSKIQIRMVNGQPCIVLSDYRCWETADEIRVDLRGTPNKCELTFEYNEEKGEWEQVDE